MTLRRIACRAAAVAAATVCCANPAAAEPGSEPASAENCQFTVSAAQPAVIPGGALAVTATLTPGACSGAFTPNTLTVCLAQDGGPRQCTTKALYTHAQVVLATSPHGRLTTTGKLCGMTISPDRYVCFTSDPVITNL
ncbi:hypothetical protein [Mycobacterium genavense]|uniref:hypothetical protein n=1 Tax=Mycobacterium genavense TaxID=36812 RepID=UPI00046F4F5F|nr:hypothetical protein [Mycobacterium genavense]